MREGKSYWLRIRGLVAVCLGVLFCLASLSPLAASASLSASHCGRKDKCCCHKAHADGPSFASRSCQSDCGRIALGSTGVSVYAPPVHAHSSPAIVVAYAVTSNLVLAHLLRVNG